jgi:hypothetical protein
MINVHSMITCTVSHHLHLDVVLQDLDDPTRNGATTGGQFYGFDDARSTTGRLLGSSGTYRAVVPTHRYHVVATVTVDRPHPRQALESGCRLSSNEDGEPVEICTVQVGTGPLGEDHVTETPPPSAVVAATPVRGDGVRCPLQISASSVGTATVRWSALASDCAASGDSVNLFVDPAERRYVGSSSSFHRAGGTVELAGGVGVVAAHLVVVLTGSTQGWSTVPPQCVVQHGGVTGSDLACELRVVVRPS